MQWKWREVKRSGSSSRKSERLSGGTKFNVFLVLVFLVAVGWAVATFSAPYLRKDKLENTMADRMRFLSKSNVEDMIIDLTDEAKKIGLPPLTRENFYFEGGPGQDSLLRVKYVEKIKLYDDKWYVMPLVAEKELHIPKEMY